MFAIIKFVCIFTGAICASIATKDPRYMWLLLMLIPSFIGDCIRLTLRNMPVYKVEMTTNDEDDANDE